MIRRLIRWIRGKKYGRGYYSRKRTEELTEEFDGYSLYELGEAMCSQKYTKQDMYLVLQSWYGDVPEIEPEWVEDLDLLLGRSIQVNNVHETTPDLPITRKVETFREKFFRQFTPDEIMSTLGHMYRTERDESFGLLTLVGEKTTDAHIYEAEIQSYTPVVQPSTESGILDQNATFETSTVDMMKVGAEFDLSKTHITDTIREAVESEARLLWDKIETDGHADDIFSAIRDVEESHRRPDTVVSNGDIPLESAGLDRVVDGTHVIDERAIVGVSEALGYRVTQQPLEIKEIEFPPHKPQYVTVWHGNFVVTDEDSVSAFSVPTLSEIPR